MWLNPQEIAGLVNLTEEILHVELHCLCSEEYQVIKWHNHEKFDLSAVCIWETEVEKELCFSWIYNTLIICGK